MNYNVKMDALGISEFIAIEYNNKRSQYEIEVQLFSDMYNVKINKNGKDLLRYGKTFKYLFNVFRYIGKKVSIDLEVLNEIALESIKVSSEKTYRRFKVLEMDSTIGNIKCGDLLNAEIKEFVAKIPEPTANIKKITTDGFGRKMCSFKGIKLFNVTENCVYIEAEKDRALGFPLHDKTLFLNIMELHNNSHDCRTRHFGKIYGVNNALRELRDSEYYLHETIHVTEVGDFVNITYYVELDD